MMCAEPLDPQAVARLSQAALDGEAEAAITLSWHFADAGDTHEQLFWTRVAMENGSEVGRRNYAALLSRGDDARSLMRARFHLRWLATHGDQSVSTLLNEVERKLMVTDVGASTPKAQSR